jgi:hypothetical protein
MEVTAVTVAIAPCEWAKRSVHFYSAEVTRALSCPRYCFLTFPDEIFRRTGHHLSAQLFIIFVRASVPSVHMGGRFVSRVDFDQYAGNTRRSSPSRRISSTATAAILLATKSNWRSNWLAPSVLSSILAAEFVVACRTCARSFRKPRSSVAILRLKVLRSHAGTTRLAALCPWMNSGRRQNSIW